MEKFLLSRSKGQTMVLVALAAIALIAFVALAVDGGNAYAVRRQSQTAADGASMAGAYTALNYKGGSPVADILRAVNSYAESNGVADTNGVPGDPINNNVLAYYTDLNGNRLQFGGHDWELHSGPNSIPDPKQGGIEVVATISRTTFFARAIGIGNVAATAKATGLWINAQPGGGEYAIFASAPGCNNTLDVSGSEFVIEGNLHSNWDIHFGVVPELRGGGKITYVNDCTPSNNYGCEVAQRVAPQPWPVYYDIDDYAPGGRAALEAQAAGEYYYRGNGSNLTALVGDGLYFIENGGSVKLTSVGPQLYSVTIVVRDDPKAKAIEISSSEDHFEPYIDGLLMFTDLTGSNPCTVAVIKFSGSSHNWGGVIHAPNGACDMSAASNCTFHGGIFCYVVGLSGSSISVAYDSQYFPDIPPQIRLFR